MAETILAKMAVQIAANTAEFNKALSKSESTFKNFSGNITKLAGTIGLAFGVKEVAAFGFEVAKLAGEAEGVRAAFERLPNSIQLMGQLKDATAGTVSELDLMKRTVQAANFGIELESLPKLLEFAAIRAQQTGQSVDYLVDSIITGIGRKSPLILDNLGISAVRLKEQFGGAALEAQSIGDVAKAVGRIAGEELTKMGDFSENTSTKVQRLSATWENFKVVLGDVVNRSGILQAALNFGVDLLGGSSDPTKALENGLRLLNESGIEGERYAEALKAVEKQAAAAGVKLVSMTDALTGVTKVLIDPRSKVNIVDPASGVIQGETLDSLKDKLKQLNEVFESTLITDQQKLSSTGQQILSVNKQIEALEKLRKKQEEVNQGKLSTFGQKQLEDATLGSNRTEVEQQRIRQSELPSGDAFLRELDVKLPFEDPEQVLTAMNNIEMYSQAIKELGAAGVQSFDQMRLAGQLQEEQQARQTSAALQFRDAIGVALAGAVEGQKSFSQVLKQLTKQILQLFLQQALGAAIAGSFKSAKNPIVGAVLAGVATGVVSAMFSKIGGPSKSVSGSVAQPSERGTSSSFRQTLPNDQVILVGGEFRMRGNDLALVLEKSRKERQRTG